MKNDTSHPADAEKNGQRDEAHSSILNFRMRGGKPAMAASVVLILVLGAVYVYLTDGRRDERKNADPIIRATLAAPRLPELTEIAGSFKPRQTITQALLDHGLPGDLICRLVDCARPVYDLSKVIANRPYWIRLTPDGAFRDFRYAVDDERYLTVYYDVAKGNLVPVMKDYCFEIRPAGVGAVIEDSLYHSIEKIGEPDGLTQELADIFGYDIDFNTDIRKGDSFRAVVEKKYLDGRLVKNGAVLAASFMNREKVFTGIRFEDENGNPAYYAPDGTALKRSFLKSPLKVFRITSRFSYARLHPILKIRRPHLGVDYAAPVGTPVQAVGAGVVVSAGRKGANGNMVHLRHTGGYETKYLHLSRIAVKVGKRVDQGQVIGYVGSTGLSTGPHLDFRITRHGKPLNPLKVIFPPAKPVPPEKFERFARLRDQLIDEIRIPANSVQQASR